MRTLLPGMHGLLLAGILALAASSPAHAIDYVWNNPAGGSWNTATNWTPNGVPNGEDTATIALAGTYTVTLDSGVYMRSVTLGGASGTQTLALLAQMSTWSTSQCSITVNQNGVLALAGTGRLLHLGNPLVPPTTLTNHGVIDLQADVQLTSEGGNLLINTGLVKKSGGSGTAVISVNSVTNTGTYDAQVGTLSVLSNFGTLQSTGAGNTFTAQAGATLAIAGFSSTSNAFAGTTFGGAGTKTLQLSATLSGTLAATNTRIVDGVFAGTFTLNGTLDWTGGFLGGDLGSLDMTIPAGAELVIGGTGYKSVRTAGAFTTRITNSGTITFAGPAGFQSGGTPTIVNAASGLIDLASDTGISSGGNLTLANAGTLRKSAGAGTSFLRAVALTNAGTVSTQSGTLEIDGTFVQTSGRTELVGGGLTTPMFSLAQFTGGVLAGTGTITGRLNVSGSAQLRPGTSPGILTLSDANQQLAGTLYIELNGTTAGTGYDRVSATTSGVAFNALQLGGNLVVSIGAPLPVGATLTIIDVGGGNQATGGAFTGLPEGATFTVQGYVLQISYVGGTGNDVTLTVVSNSGLPCDAYSDVDAASPFCPNVEWMKKRGVTLGCAVGLYCPASPTTRLQMALFMNRLGTTLTTVPVKIEAAPGPLNPAANPVVCTTGDVAAATFERRASIDAVLMGQGQGTGEMQVEVVGSVDGGAIWVALGPPVPAGVANGRWANVRLNVDRDVAPTEVVRYGLRLTQLSGAGTLAASRCLLRLQTGNRNPNASPDADE